MKRRRMQGINENKNNIFHISKPIPYSSSTCEGIQNPKKKANKIPKQIMN